MKINTLYTILFGVIALLNQNTYAMSPDKVDYKMVVPAYLEILTRSCSDQKSRDNEVVLARYVLVKALDGDKRRRENFQNVRLACYAQIDYPKNYFTPDANAVFKEALQTMIDEDPTRSTASLYQKIINERLQNIGPVSVEALQGVKARIFAFACARAHL